MRPKKLDDRDRAFPREFVREAGARPLPLRAECVARAFREASYGQRRGPLIRTAASLRAAADRSGRSPYEGACWKQGPAGIATKRGTHMGSPSKKFIWALSVGAVATVASGRIGRGGSDTLKTLYLISGLPE